MKKLLLIISILFTLNLIADVDTPITITPEVKPSIDKIKITLLTLYPIDKQATIVLAYGYLEDGKFQSKKYTTHDLKGVQYNQLLTLLGITGENVPTIINNLKE